MKCINFSNVNCRLNMGLDEKNFWNEKVTYIKDQYEKYRLNDTAIKKNTYNLYH